MSYALTGGLGWNMGYRIIGFMQMALTAILLFSLPLWKRRSDVPAEPEEATAKTTLSLRQIFRIPGAKEVMLAFSATVPSNRPPCFLGQQLYGAA